MYIHPTPTPPHHKITYYVTYMTDKISYRGGEWKMRGEGWEVEVRGGKWRVRGEKWGVGVRGGKWS